MYSDKKKSSLMTIQTSFPGSELESMQKIIRKLCVHQGWLQPSTDFSWMEHQPPGNLVNEGTLRNSRSMKFRTETASILGFLAALMFQEKRLLAE